MEPYTSFPKIVEDIMTILLLGNWNMRDQKFFNAAHGYWWTILVPFIIKVTDDLFDAPERAPDISCLRNVIEREFNTEKTKDFKILIKHFTRLFEQVSDKGDQWRFFDIAKGDFVKPALA
jgi:hypothetical protein